MTAEMRKRIDANKKAAIMKRKKNNQGKSIGFQTMVTKFWKCLKENQKEKATNSVQLTELLKIAATTKVQPKFNAIISKMNADGVLIKRNRYSYDAHESTKQNTTLNPHKIRKVIGE